MEEKIISNINDNPKLLSKKKSLSQLLQRYCLSLEDLMTIKGKMELAFQNGLKYEEKTYHYSPLKMIPTHLCHLPDGNEAGSFYSIDLGGTNLRFIKIAIIDGDIKLSCTSYSIPISLMNGKGEDLFDFLAECISEGLEKYGLSGTKLQYIGFTFSYPVRQLALNRGELIRWTKGFSATGVEGEDVVQLLKQACERKGVFVGDFILINDTTGTLLSGAFEKQATKIAIINGTGTNACYLELVKNLKNFICPPNIDSIIINTEWGSFGENGELDEWRTLEDLQVNEMSINPDQQIFEKMIAGMYLGEIARKITISISEYGFIFSKNIPLKFMNPDSFPTEMISLSHSKKEFIKYFTEKFDYHLTEEEYLVLFKISDCVARRSADLCAAGLAAILSRIQCPEGVIAADGSVFKKHPHYICYVSSCLKKIISGKRDFDLILVEDGSGKGAALAACVASSKKLIFSTD